MKPEKAFEIYICSLKNRRVIKYVLLWDEQNTCMENAKKLGVGYATACKLKRDYGLSCRIDDPWKVPRRQRFLRGIAFLKQQGQGKTLQKIADEVGLTRERVRQIIASVVKEAK